GLHRQGRHAVGVVLRVGGGAVRPAQGTAVVPGAGVVPVLALAWGEAEQRLEGRRRGPPSRRNGSAGPTRRSPTPGSRTGRGGGGSDAPAPTAVRAWGTRPCPTPTGPPPTPRHRRRRRCSTRCCWRSTRASP